MKIMLVLATIVAATVNIQLANGQCAGPGFPAPSFTVTFNGSSVSGPPYCVAQGSNPATATISIAASVPGGTDLYTYFFSTDNSTWGFTNNRDATWQNATPTASAVSTFLYINSTAGNITVVVTRNGGCNTADMRTVVLPIRRLFAGGTSIAMNVGPCLAATNGGPEIWLTGGRGIGNTPVDWSFPTSTPGVNTTVPLPGTGWSWVSEHAPYIISTRVTTNGGWDAPGGLVTASIPGCTGTGSSISRSIYITNTLGTLHFESATANPPSNLDCFTPANAVRFYTDAVVPVSNQPVTVSYWWTCPPGWNVYNSSTLIPFPSNSTGISQTVSTGNTDPGGNANWDRNGSSKGGFPGVRTNVPWIILVPGSSGTTGSINLRNELDGVCSSTNSISAVFSSNCSDHHRPAPGGGDETTPSNEIKMAPNPASNSTTFTLPAYMRDVVIQVSDSKGSVVLRKTINGGSTRVNTSALAAGVYNVMIMLMDGKVTNQRLVIAR